MKYSLVEQGVIQEALSKPFSFLIDEGRCCLPVLHGIGSFGVGPVGSLGTTQENCGFAPVRQLTCHSESSGQAGFKAHQGTRLFRHGPTLKGVLGPVKTADFRHYSDWPESSDLFFEDAGTDRVEPLLAAAARDAVFDS